MCSTDDAEPRSHDAGAGSRERGGAVRFAHQPTLVTAAPAIDRSGESQGLDGGTFECKGERNEKTRFCVRPITKQTTKIGLGFHIVKSPLEVLQAAYPS
jgi:hypothetical protein